MGDLQSDNAEKDPNFQVSRVDEMGGIFLSPKKWNLFWTLCNLSMCIIDHKRIRKCYKGNGRGIGFNNLCWSAWGALNCRRDRFSDTENVPRIVFIILQFVIWKTVTIIFQIGTPQIHKIRAIRKVERIRKIFKIHSLIRKIK